MPWIHPLLRAQTPPPAPLAGVPVHVMEFHLWWCSPFYGPPEQRIWTKWGEPAEMDRAIGPSWRRQTSSGACPLIGPYNSADPEVIRWQLRCAKAAGIAALQVQLFSNLQMGSWFGREKVFADVVRIAGEEKMPIYLHDEAQFRPPPSNLPEVMADRIATALNRYGSLPGYFKFSGKPAVSFQYWKQYMTPADLRQMMETVDHAVPSGVHFVLNGIPDPSFADLDAMGTIIPTSNASLLRSAEDRSETIDAASIDAKMKNLRALRQIFPGKRIGLWAYPGFDNTGQFNPKPRWFPRGTQLSSLRQTLERYAAEEPSIIVLSSWNDWQENTALEPALDVDGFNGDPYQALRTIAELQGKTFTPPPLPPFASMDPWMSGALRGPVHMPPRFSAVHALPEQAAARCEAVDEVAAVAKISVARTPAATVSWPAGKIAARGFSESSDTAATQQRQGRFGRELTTDFAVPAAPDLFEKGEKIWLALTVWDGAKTKLRVEYLPAGGKKIEPTDETGIPPGVWFPLDGARRWRTVVLALDDIDASAASGRLGVVRAVSGSEPVLLGAVDIFRARDFGTGDISELCASAGRNVVTALVKNLSTDPHLVRPSLLTAEDAKGNRMLPFAVDLGATGGNGPTDLMGSN